jgi:hypothetical protein
LKTFTKILVLIAELLGCLAVLVGAVYGVYWLCGFLPQNPNYDLFYLLAVYTLNYAAPALLALGYSLLVYAVLKNNPKRILAALLNGVVMMGFTTGAFLLFSEKLLGYMPVAPVICIFSLILSLILLALRPKSLPQAETAAEAAKVG